MLLWEEIACLIDKEITLYQNLLPHLLKEAETMETPPHARPIIKGTGMTTVIGRTGGLFTHSKSLHTYKKPDSHDTIKALLFNAAPLYLFKHQSAFPAIHPYDISGLIPSLQDKLRKFILNVLLNRTPQRPGPELAVISLFKNEFFCAA